MKRVLIPLCAIFVCLSNIFAYTPKKEPVMEYLNFKMENDILIWSKVFEMNPEDSLAVRQWFAREFTITWSEGNTISGETKKAVLPHDAVGLTTGRTSMALLDPAIVYFSVYFKENRYKVVVDKAVWDAVMFHAQSVRSLSTAANSKEGITKGFINGQASKQLDTILIYVFTPKIVKQDDAW